MLHPDLYRILSEAFQADGIRNFHPDEFVPPRVAVPPPGFIHRLPLIARVCQDLREASSGRVNINSGYRDPQYNERIGGAERSQHTRCTAADVTVREWTPDRVAEWAEVHPWADLMGIGRYDTFTHLDVRGLFGDPAPARWDNRA